MIIHTCKGLTKRCNIDQWKNLFAFECVNCLQCNDFKINILDILQIIMFFEIASSITLIIKKKKLSTH